MVGTDPFTRVSVEAKPALYWPSLLKQSDVKWLAHTYKLTRTTAGMLSLKMKCNHCLFCCSVAGTEYRHWCWFLQPTMEQCACLTRKHCYLTAGGWTPPSQISSLTVQRRPAYENDFFRQVRTGAESKQPVGAPCYQWMGCRDHAGIVCVPHSWSWQAQGGSAYICRDQRKCVFHNMGPLNIYLHNVNLFERITFPMFVFSPIHKA